MDALLFRAARTSRVRRLDRAQRRDHECTDLSCVRTLSRANRPRHLFASSRRGRHGVFEIHLSGGFAGLNRELQLSSTGELSATDRRRDTHVTARVSADEISKIGSLIPVAPASPSRKTGCADCFLYDLTLHVRGRSVVVRTDDVSLGGSDIEPLVRNLVALLDRAMTGRLNVQGQRQ